MKIKFMVMLYVYFLMFVWPAHSADIHESDSKFILLVSIKREAMLTYLDKVVANDNQILDFEINVDELKHEAKSDLFINKYSNIQFIFMTMESHGLLGLFLLPLVTFTDEYYYRLLKYSLLSALAFSSVGRIIDYMTMGDKKMRVGSNFIKALAEFKIDEQKIFQVTENDKEGTYEIKVLRNYFKFFYPLMASTNY